MKYIKTFENLSKNDIAIAGGKGASLGEITQMGILIPAGFVILVPAFEHFLEETDINIEIDAIINKVNYEDIKSIDNASEEIKNLILNANFPKDIALEIKKDYKKLNAEYVAVRSSATAEDSSVASWAGELETYLNITKEELLENVKKCWASLFTPRAIFYRFEKGLNKTKISVAVVIQKMIDSEVAGITFTVHPVTKDKDQMVIEAGWGLGEAIVGGQITPDNYVVHKIEKNIVDINVSEQNVMIVKKEGKTEEVSISIKKQNKQKLNKKQIFELAEICKKIEKHYDFPCDIEWAFAKDMFYILQSRPITTLQI